MGLSLKRLARHEVLLGNVEVLLGGDEILLELQEKIARELATDSNLDPVLLAGPEMLDELALTARVALGETVGLGAEQLLDILGIIVANVGTETSLIGGLTRAIQLEFSAIGVLAALLRAGVPLVEDLVGLVVVLGDDETSVEIDVAELVLVVLSVGISGKGERVGGGVKVPVVHEPLEGEVEVVEDGVRVEVDAGIVLLEDLGHDVGLLPGITAILVGVDIDIVVLVTVDLGCGRVSTRNAERSGGTYHRPSG